MSIKEFINSDLHRINGVVSFKSGLKFYLLSPGYKYMFWHRIANVARTKGKIVYLFPKLILRHYSYKYGFDIPAETIIGKGFYIGHFSGVVISPKVVIGKNCNISQCVTIGYAPRGKHPGYPKIGDNVYIAPGAKIIGGIKIGDNVAIGANAVVLDDVPENAVVVGIPAKVISYKGSKGYIFNKVE